MVGPNCVQNIPLEYVPNLCSLHQFFFIIASSLLTGSLYSSFNTHTLTMASNHAAWITGKQVVPLEVKEAPVPKPAADEIIISNKAVAINPVDWKIQVCSCGGFCRGRTERC